MYILQRKLNIISDDLYKLCKYLKLAGYVVRLVGGCVRDALLDINFSDIDIITNATPDQVIDVFSTHDDIKILPTGIKYGTVTACLDNQSFEITTLRKDIKCNGRHAMVEFTDDFKLDAMRRDFTINALSYCPFENKIYDYHNGINDLYDNKVVFIGNPVERIKEDYLRILRFFRFTCRFAKTIDKESLDACILLKDNIFSLSRERIKSEMDRLLLNDHKGLATQIMHDCGILYNILPVKNFDSAVFRKLNETACLMEINVVLTTYYALLLQNISNITHSELINLKFSNKESKKIISLLDFQKVYNELKDYNKFKFFLKRNWLYNDDYAQYFLFITTTISNSQNSNTKNFNNIINLYYQLSSINRKPIFPLTGNDLIKKPNISGESIGKYLRILEKQWIESDFTLTKEQLINL